MKPVGRRGAVSARRQNGVVLIVALLVLITMMLAGIALMRQMNAGSSIAGNVAFKENATSAADRGIEVARQWLMANPALLNDDTAANARPFYRITSRVIGPRNTYSYVQVVIQ
jgi:Tfp pilus assembly protein PilX